MNPAWLVNSLEIGDLFINPRLGTGSVILDKFAAQLKRDASWNRVIQARIDEGREVQLNDDEELQAWRASIMRSIESGLTKCDCWGQLDRYKPGFGHPLNAAWVAAAAILPQAELIQLWRNYQSIISGDAIAEITRVNGAFGHLGVWRLGPGTLELTSAHKRFYAAALMALVVLCSDGYFDVARGGVAASRYFRIMMRLPIELQQVLARRTCGLNGTNALPRDEASWRNIVSYWAAL